MTVVLDSPPKPDTGEALDLLSVEYWCDLHLELQLQRRTRSEISGSRI